MLYLNEINTNMFKLNVQLIRKGEFCFGGGSLLTICSQYLFTL